MDSKEKAFSEYLVIRCQQGSRQALRSLLDMWQSRLLAYATNRLGDRDSAQDALQEGLLAICRNLYKLEDPTSFPRWAFTIVERRCMDQLRRLYHEQSVLDAAAAEQEAVAEDKSDQSLDSNRLLAQLPTELAALLRLYYLEELKLEDIARILAIPVGT